MATYHKLTFQGSVTNTSLQSYDQAYKVSTQPGNSLTVKNGITYASASPVLIGVISQVGQNFIIIKDMVNAPLASDFIMFAKNQAVNKPGIKGHYAEITLENNSTELVELFSIASEVVQSSK